MPHGRLVQHDQPGLAHQGSPHGQHLLLAAGQRARWLPTPLPEHREQRVHPVDSVADLRRFAAAAVRTELEVLLHRHPRPDPAPSRPGGATAPHDLVRRGTAHSPEGRRIFPRMTIEENLELGAYSRRGKTAEIRDTIDRVYALFPMLGERRGQPAGTLSGGEQQMLAVGRALMSQPRLIMLDEPSMGLSPIMMQKIFSTLVELKGQGTTILLVEQNAQAALSLADRGYVIETGRIVLEDNGPALLGNELVRKAYLGCLLYTSPSP